MCSIKYKTLTQNTNIYKYLYNVEHKKYMKKMYIKHHKKINI